MKLAVVQDEPLALGVTEVEKESVNVGECVPEAQDEPLALGVTEVEMDSVNDGECVPL